MSGAGAKAAGYRAGVDSATMNGAGAGLRVNGAEVSA